MKRKQIHANLENWRKASPQELQQQLVELHKDLQSFQMQKATGQLGQGHMVGATRRDIARIKTVMGQQSQAQAQ